MALVGNTHLIAGGAEALDAVVALLGKEGFDTRANPDLYVRAYTHFGIDEARELRERAQLSALGGRRAFVIFAPQMTSDAQNALLKTFEEPAADSYFFLIVPSPESLLSTLRSRMQRLDVGAMAKDEAGAKAFLGASPHTRLDMLKVLLGKDEGDERDIARIIALLAGLEAALAGRIDDPKVREGLGAVYRARSFMNDKGALVKPLLEQVALLVPAAKA